MAWAAPAERARDESPIARRAAADDGCRVTLSRLRSLARHGAVVALLLVAPSAALAKDGGSGSDDRREARVTATCSKGATAELRLRSRDGAIRLEFELRRRRSGELWRVAVVQERRVVWRASLRTRGSSGSLRVRRSLRDLDGPDRVTVRASGPRGLTCEASAMLRA
jgi:hypothetical protein